MGQRDRLGSPPFSATVIISVQSWIHELQFAAKHMMDKSKGNSSRSSRGKRFSGTLVWWLIRSLCKFLYLVPELGEAAAGLFLSHVISGPLGTPWFKSTVEGKQ